MHPAQSPGLVLVSLALIMAACSPLTPTQTTLPSGGMRTATAGITDMFGLGAKVPAEMVSALALVPLPPVSPQTLPIQTLPIGQPIGLLTTLPSSQPVTFPAALPSVYAPPPVNPGTSGPGYPTSTPSVASGWQF
ncbi:MAG: hypothetical protein H7338_14960 [Candidatus Sericytochromatia bacterium]|nr:hypothetical protein [Candidatus Sericytochromatia bacterium]